MFQSIFYRLAVNRYIPTNVPFLLSYSEDSDDKLAKSKNDSAGKLC